MSNQCSMSRRKYVSDRALVFGLLCPCKKLVVGTALIEIQIKGYSFLGEPFWKRTDLFLSKYSPDDLHER